MDDLKILRALQLYLCENHIDSTLTDSVLNLHSCYVDSQSPIRINIADGNIVITITVSMRFTSIDLEDNPVNPPLTKGPKPTEDEFNTLEGPISNLHSLENPQSFQNVLREIKWAKAGEIDKLEHYRIGGLRA